MLQAEPAISWTEVTKFVGQLSHDLRNHLNAIELQVAFLNEIVEQPETKAEIKRLREMTGEIGAHLQKVSRLLERIQPTPMAYSAAEFVEDLRSKLEREQPEQKTAVEWQVSLGAEAMEIDPQLLQEAFLELFRNASMHGRGAGPLRFAARNAGPAIEFTLREPKEKFDRAVEDWGQRPLGHLRHGHYGLGLFRARGIFEKHDGTLRAQFDLATSELVTTVSLPRLAS